MKEHLSHNILGRYCWTCQLPVENGIPYWPKSHKGAFTRYSIWEINEVTGQGYTESIIWANGDSDRRQNQNEPCAMCHRHCRYPVNKGITDQGDMYREIGRIREFSEVKSS